jgi:hypothetical protein
MLTQLANQGTQARTAEPVVGGGRGRLGAAWHRLRGAVQDMNYASRRVIELQAPWIVDDHWHSR